MKTYKVKIEIEEYDEETVAFKLLEDSTAEFSSLNEATKFAEATAASCLKSKIISEALWNYHHDLDTHKHGGLAASNLAAAVEIALDTPWVRGATLSEASNPNTVVSDTAPN